MRRRKPTPESDIATPEEVARWLKPRHKFHAVPTEVDGIKFASKAEARYYQKLKLMQEERVAALEKRAQEAEARAERWHTFATHRQTHITQLKAEVESLCRHVCASSCPECAAIREAKKGDPA